MHISRYASLSCAAILLAGAAMGQNGQQPSAAAAARFLEQASWGPTPSTIAAVRQTGFSEYIDAQFTAPESPIPSVPLDAKGRGPMRPIQNQFFVNAISGQDQLRQRVAFALHQIWVVSGVKINNPDAMAGYLRTLQRDAFGNYYELMHDVTLTPAMGHYLDMVNNDKPNAKTGKGANENYAREILQLFTVGLNQLDAAAQARLDADGKPIPTYIQEDIEELARAFTGWTYAPLPGATPRGHNPPNWNASMTPVERLHDTDVKSIMGATLPARQTADQDLHAALTIIFQHPNVGPFICRQLIQHLVTSSPSADYVARVAAIFDNNGGGVRGDLKAVVKSILLDAEARQGDNAEPDPASGHLREPVLFITGLLRAFNATVAPENGLPPYGSGLGQNVYFPPTVFNYFPPDYEIAGTTINAPEFGILSTSTAMLRADFVNALIYGRINGVSVDLAPYVAMAGTPQSLLDGLSGALLRGNMPQQMREILLGAVTAAPTPKAKAQTAAYLIASSSQYQVQR